MKKIAILSAVLFCAVSVQAKSMKKTNIILDRQASCSYTDVTNGRSTTVSMPRTISFLSVINNKELFSVEMRNQGDINAKFMTNISAPLTKTVIDGEKALVGTLLETSHGALHSSSVQIMKNSLKGTLKVRSQKGEYSVDRVVNCSFNRTLNLDALKAQIDKNAMAPIPTPAPKRKNIRTPISI